MSTPLSDAQIRAWKTYADTARRSGVTEIVTGEDPTDLESMRRAVQTVSGVIDKLLAELDSEIEELRGAGGKGGAIEENIEAAWRRLEEACRKVESDLRTPNTLRTRLDEGRRSMMPKVERMVRERLEPQVTRKGRRLEASLKPEGLNELRQELPQWVSGWALYVFRWLDVDLQRELEIAWSPRDGELPISPPDFTPLEPPALAGEIKFPEISIGRDTPNVASGIARHVRSIMYGLMSLTFLFGVSRDTIPTYVYFVGVIAALGYGYVVSQQERQTDRDRLEQELRQKADQATWDAVRVWLDRSQDRLVEGAREQTQRRRAEFVSWYRREVIPQQQQRKRDAERKARLVDKARFELPKIQEKQRNAKRVETALQTLSTSIRA